MECLPGVFGVDLAEEREELLLAQAVADHLDDFAAAVVGQAEESLKVLHLAEVADDWAVVAAGPPAVIAGQAQVFPADRGEPAQAAGPDDQRGVAAVLR